MEDFEGHADKGGQEAWPSDDPVLEFLNTLPMVEGNLEDQLQTDADVLRMLARLGWAVRYGGTGLVEEARGLREELRGLIERRKAGKRLGLERLNEYLIEAKSHVEVREERPERLVAERVWGAATARQALGPLAEAAVDLLAGGEFELIRRCESETCVLWFYDRTKSHQRRWCSMATCGNRSKVAAFRKRRAEG